MKKKKPKTPEQIAQRNLLRNISNKNSVNNDNSRKSGVKIVQDDNTAFMSGGNRDFTCSKRGIVIHKANIKKYNPSSKVFSKKETIIINKYRDGILTKDEANKELESIAQSRNTSHKGIK